MSTNNPYKTAVNHYLGRTGYPRVAPRAALIDMDGTLYDSMGHHTLAWQRMMREIGVDVPRDEFYLYEGMTGAATITHLFDRELHRIPTAEEISRLYHRKTELFSEQPAVGPMPGAHQALDFLVSQGIRCVLVTGSGQGSLIGRLEADYPHVFAPGDYITSRDVTKGKPHPEPYLKGMALAGIEPWQGIVLENAPLGIKAGADAGAFTIGVTTGPIPIEKMLEAGADIVFDSMQQCADALPQLFQQLKSTL